MVKRPQRQRNKRRGQSLTELAMILPLMMLVFFGMVEIGWWVQSWISVATAAREGARFGSRGLHVTGSEIAEVANVSLSSTLNVKLEGLEANVRIIVTQIDVEPNGSLDVYDIYTLGDLDVGSSVCTLGPCDPDSIDIIQLSEANLAFNDNPSFCGDEDGCRADIVVVEAYYEHRLLLPVPFITDYINEHITLNGRGIMRVLFRREVP
ncbi:MAG: pilus assembly protein [Anaerolineales bacterium]